MAIQGPTGPASPPPNFGDPSVNVGDNESAIDQTISELTQTPSELAQHHLAYTNHAQTYCQQLADELTKYKSFLETLPSSDLNMILGMLRPYAMPASGPGQPMYYDTRSHARMPPNFGRPYEISKGFLQPFAEATDDSALGAAIANNGTITVNSLKNDFGKINWAMDQVVVAMFQGQAFNTGTPWSTPLPISLQTMPSDIEFFDFYKQQQNILTTLSTLGITTIDFSNPDSDGAKLLESYYSQYMGIVNNPFSSAPIPKDSLLEYLASKGLYTPGTGKSTLESVQTAAFTALKMLTSTPPTTITPTQWNNFKNLLEQLENNPSSRIQNVAKFMVNMIDNISTTSTTMQAWMMEALGQGLQSSTQPPTPSQGFYSWISDNFTDGTELSPKQFFGYDPDLNFDPPMSDLSMILFNVMMDYGAFNTPSGADLITDLNNDLFSQVDVPMPGSSGPFPDISALTTDGSDFYNLIILFAQAGSNG